MTLKCLEYLYNSSNSSATQCKGTYEECAREVECPVEGQNHCFRVVSTVATNSSTSSETIPQVNKILSAGCYAGHNNSIESCDKECIGQPKGPPERAVFYCCCTESLCNKSLKILPHAPKYEQPQGKWESPDRGAKISETSSAFVTVMLFVAILIMLALGVYVKKTRRKCPNSNSICNNRSHTHHNHTNDCSSNNKNCNLNGQELNELRNNPDVALLMPFQDSNDSHRNHNQTTTTVQNNTCNNNTIYTSNDVVENHHHQQLIDSNNRHRQQHESVLKIDLEQIRLLEIVGSGRFGTVHRAILSAPKDSDKDPELHKGNLKLQAHLAASPDQTRFEIAVKIIQSVEHQSWQYEVKVYNALRLRHPNILGFVGSQHNPKTDSYWLIVEYCPKGSLHHYLKQFTVSWNEFLRISLGIVRGLSHLHDADIAHRDFKSKNVLLRADLTPCITDFGVAVMLDAANSSQTEHRKKFLQVGTPRYMAPEILECSVAFTKTAFTKIDVYALSLVLWELISRCHPLPQKFFDETKSCLESSYSSSVAGYGSDSGNEQQQLRKLLHQQQGATAELPTGGASKPPRDGQSPATRAAYESVDEADQNDLHDQCATAEESNSLEPQAYKLPFESVVGQNPDINTMRQVVILEKLRPPIKQEWHVHPISILSQAIIDGWEYDYDARISASCFVERIEGLQQYRIQQHPAEPNCDEVRVVGGGGTAATGAEVHTSA